ncbi:efflux RND transporter periplasmic adaptor subunit [Pedobacter psychroterrae]|uniref:HlyD family efflux transporter periplasmic adaptor subunit n=1 Tax=Pedobacter psychroterrae TaxID=2530453 RepID=A0A4R0NMD5_9SPHI|nr:HlyD family efflux transporter periplasmic adaptor subunit [Pedobacter psychroterrae]TCD00225.1 HlyD family efflux transporter periplasmic adaptor subunit [Pedobacter psychroterrae]
MDKQIEEEVTARKKRKRYIVLAAIVTGIAVAVFAMRSYIKPSLAEAEFISAVAETGNIENTINATGEILPEFEEVLTSPINAAVRKVVMDAGTKVKAGQSILTLDKSAAQTEYDKLGFQIESKENEIRKLKLDLEKSFYDIKSNNSIKQLRIANFKDAVLSAQRLFKAGGGTREDIERAELELKVAELEKQQLENEIRNKQQTMKIEIREAEIALAIQGNDQAAFSRKLALAEVIATRDGVVTWVNKNIGASIKEGESLARIANLSSYKVAGSISDTQMDQLSKGMPVIVLINDTQLRGSIANVSPSVNNSILSFDVQLEEKNNKLLRPNMKADVFLVTATRNNVIRVPNGPAFRGSDMQEIFVLSKGKAVRRSVKTGLSNFDFIEIVSGIKVGERVITSDMSKYEYASEISITN